MSDVLETPGLTRAYFYQRFVHAAREVLSRETYQEDQEPEMVAKVNVQDALDRLTSCPVCGAGLVVYPDYPLERSCTCGDFTITEVWSDGDVTFEFKMASPEKLEAENNASQDDGG